MATLFIENMCFNEPSMLLNGTFHLSHLDFSYFFQ